MRAGLEVLTIKTVMDVAMLDDNAISAHVEVMRVAIMLYSAVRAYIAGFDGNRLPITAKDTHIAVADLTVADDGVCGSE